MYGSLRTRCWWSLKRRLGHRLQYVYNLWNDTMFERAIVGRYNLSLNLHRDCGDSQQPIEAFRVSQLVSAGRLVISERSYPRDEAEYKGIGTHAILRLGNVVSAFPQSCPDPCMTPFAQFHSPTSVHVTPPVIFAPSSQDNVSGIVNVSRRLFATLAGRDSWQAIAQSAQQRFREHFAPTALFQRAGIYSSFSFSVR